MHRFPSAKGRVCGIISGVFGGSPLLWDFVQTKLVNPHGVALDASIGYAAAPQVIARIPRMFAYVAALQLAMQAVAAGVVSNPAWYTPQQQQEDDEAMSAAQSEYEKHSLTMRMALKQPSFWSLWLNNFLFSLVLMWVAAEWKQLAMDALGIRDDAFLATVGSVAALMNGLGRFGWGAIYDRIESFPAAMGGMTGFVGVAIATLPLLPALSQSDAPRLLFLFMGWVCAIWLCVGCQYAFLPTVVAETFGAKHTGSILGLFVWSEAPASLLVVVCTQFEATLFGGWTGYCLFIAACSAVSFVLSLLYRSEIDRKAIIERETLTA